jgi:hypothetical protein
VRRLCTKSSGQATSMSKFSWAMALRFKRCFRFQRLTRSVRSSIRVCHVVFVPSFRVQFPHLT